MEHSSSKMFIAKFIIKKCLTLKFVKYNNHVHQYWNTKVSSKFLKNPRYKKFITSQ